MIVGIKSVQDQGKTVCAVSLVRELVTNHGYVADEVWANVALTMPGAHCVSSAGMRGLMGRMVTERWRHKILLIDEINRVYPARFWADKERTAELLTVWQDEKCFHFIIYTCHVGNSVDVLVREATQIILVPKYDRVADRVNLVVVNSLDLETHHECIDKVSRFFGDYDRWEVVV